MDKNHDVKDGILKRTKHPEARDHLAAFFKHLDKIKTNDEAVHENELEDYVNNDSDGVACHLAADLDNLRKQKIERIKKLNNEVVLKESISDETEAAPVVADSADINARGRYGYTRIIDATARNDIDEVKRLLDLGADWKIPDNWGQTAWDKAYNRGHDAILLLFDPAFVRTEAVPLMNYDDD